MLKEVASTLISTLDSLHLIGKQILLRAFRDLSIPAEAEDATQFLLATTPDQQDALETWCAFARFNPNTVRQRTAAYLEKGAFV